MVVGRFGSFWVVPRFSNYLWMGRFKNKHHPLTNAPQPPIPSNYKKFNKRRDVSSSKHVQDFKREKEAQMKANLFPAAENEVEINASVLK